MKLYELANGIREALDTADDGELQPEQLDALDILNVQLDEKIDGCCSLIREWEAMNAAKQAEIDRLRAGMDTKAGNVKRLKEYMKHNLETIGANRHETSLFTVRIQANTPGCDCIEPDITKLDPKYIRTKQEPDKIAALDEWKRTGQAPNGFEIRKGSHLRIK